MTMTFRISRYRELSHLKTVELDVEGMGERNLAGGIIGSWNGGKGRPRQLLEGGNGRVRFDRGTLGS